MAGTFQTKDNRAWILREVQKVPEKEKLKINLGYLPWKPKSMEIPPVKWVSGKFGLEFAIEQIECRQIFPDLGQR